jgi:hypothetical protein
MASIYLNFTNNEFTKNYLHFGSYNFYLTTQVVSFLESLSRFIILSEDTHQCRQKVPH